MWRSTSLPALLSPTLRVPRVDGATTSKPPIAAVLARYYGLDIKVQRGRQKICCPLHADEHPSASVNVDADRWACFVCSVSEDSYAVIMREEGIGFTEAQKLARREFSGDWADVSRDVPRQSSRGVRSRSRAFGGSSAIRSGVRRFGDTWT
ncbi:CHC2 zinc finger domain-containing protein [Streptomyces sp. NPDC059874]|uniref:CHC2 zinc finger domain-containing protein n=1 Tax=Streptomyces sp. NPDC059874 TaxID=3346983 RepID=UPI00364E2CD6